MSEATVFESRLNNLEQDNRRLKLALGSLLLVLAVASCAGAMIPEQTQDIVQAREFRMIDANDTVLIAINDEGFSYFDEIGRVSWSLSHGEIIAIMAADAQEVIDAERFRVVDENGVVRAAMYAQGITFFDAAQNVVWSSPGQ
mgnify:CR=1 FL=1